MAFTAVFPSGLPGAPLHGQIRAPDEQNCAYRSPILVDAFETYSWRGTLRAGEIHRTRGDSFAGFHVRGSGESQTCATHWSFVGIGCAPYRFGGGGAYLDTNVPGVFAAGDVRRCSVKRGALAVGEGAMAVAFVQRYLASV